MANSNSLQLGNFVWNDKNGNGIQDAGELGIANVTVRLWGWNSTTGKFDQKFTTDAKTDVNGVYQFSGMDVGSYRAEFVLPSDYVFTRQKDGVTDTKNSDANTTTGITGDINLDPQVSFSNEYVDAGMVLRSDLGSIGDKVWYDNNADGAQDISEQGIANVTVKLYYADGTFIKQMQTDNTGKYLFTELLPTQYKVQFIAPNGHVFSPKDATVDDKDSDADRSTGYTADINLTAGGSVLTVDAGLYKPAAIGDLLWIDKNRNGQQDAGEAGLGGVNVTLTQGARTWTTVTSTVAGKEGSYLFDELPEGQFNVKFNLPSGYLFTLQDYISDNSKDSDVDINGQTTVTLTSGQRTLDVDAGVYPKSEGTSAMLGNFVWRDVNADGVQDTSAGSLEKGIGGVKVKLYNASDVYVKTTSTDGNGIYGFNELVPGNYYVTFAPQAGLRFSPQDSIADDTRDSDANSVGRTGVYTLLPGQVDYSVDAGLNALGSIGDTVWFDKVTNGIQDGAAAGEVGMGQVKVDLYRYDAVSKTWDYNYKTTTTDGNGQYLFDNLPAAQYAVKVNPPTGYGTTLQNQGLDESKDSDFDATTNVAYYTLKAGEDVRTVDVGLLQLGSIGDKVWKDNNANGVQDGEAGFAGVTVKLYKYNAATGAWDYNYRSTKTDGNGLYVFDKLPAAKYAVKFVTPAGYVLSKANQAADDKDSDPDPSTGVAYYTLAPGENVTTIDAGMYKAAAVGDRLWYDHSAAGEQDGQQTSGERGLSGATIWLFSSTGARYSTTTGNDGIFHFTGLPPGTYRMSTSNQNMYYAPYHQGAAATDSDLKWSISAWGLDGSKAALATGVSKLGNFSSAGAPFDGGSGYTPWFTLSAGQTDNTRDLGLTPLVVDLNKDGIHTLAREHASATFDLLGNGQSINSGWIAADDGLLAIDSNHNGKIDSIHELFGGLKQGDGFAKLAQFDSNGDGVVNNLDAQFAELKIWQDCNSNHQTDAGELMSLAQAGVVSLNVHYVVVPELDAQGNLQLERSSATLADGSSTSMNDVYFNVAAADAVQANVTLPSMADLLSQDNSLDGVLGSVMGPLQVVAATPIDTSALDGLKQLAQLYDQAASAV